MSEVRTWTLPLVSLDRARRLMAETRFRMRIRQLVPIALSLAWVLWSMTAQRSDPTKIVYTPVDSWGSEAECKSQAQEREARERLNLVEDIRFRCFPEGIDPRPRT